jgi:hypothetical protein
MEYRRLGCEVSCAACHVVAAARVPVGGSYPATQWELNFRDFLALTRDDASRRLLAPLLNAWFGFSLEQVGERVRILDAAGRAQDPLDVHLQIQDDSDKQLTIYQTAMSLWR